ncbi:retinol dehydrogenase [Colletotrichum higginsianum]|uniref:Retinol dehydrogenase n=2 Tax=Colletotrichum higginsianum TaxID=80884 RepID=H1V0R9_COLHI|nr:Retinol dehydrogenase [Colletotrichum higginsianum IMI 349063]OBR13361.1 Retinol dehydrogenase [Colletotrichum higginsianum IMI 349063]TID02404.1 putative oxidoreductase [Colletotrichum higginsianum]GJC95966.1 retinol dehydrogenase [Colletotrichum higginsianum]CCF33820.1 retinol dehydrogenase [Colletotrichum higginsianum]
MPFSPEKDIPDLSGKVIIVTGGSSGLGKESALQLAKHNPAAIYLTARTEARGAAAIREIQAAVPSAKDTIKFLELDLGSFASVQKAAATFLASSDRLDILMNNAGLLASAAGLTPDGYETQFGSNYMGPSLFTKLLLPVLARTAERPGADVRVVNLSSELFKQAPKGGILLDSVKTPMHNISSVARYGQSKLADYYHTRVLSRLYPAIKFVGIHPGVVNTGIFDDLVSRQPWLSGVAGVIGSVFLTDVRTGVRTQLWASTADRATVKSGGFYNQKIKEFKEAILYDDKAAQELWDWTEREFESKGV